MKCLFNVPLLIVSLLTLVGCNGGAKGPIQAREDASEWPQISFTDENLRNKTAVRQPIVSRDEAGNLLHVTVPIRSTSNRQILMEYRASFYDPNGAPISQTTWFPKTLNPNTQDTITVNSTSPRAADFQIDFRYGK